MLTASVCSLAAWNRILSFSSTQTKQIQGTLLSAKVTLRYLVSDVSFFFLPNMPFAVRARNSTADFFGCRTGYITQAFPFPEFSVPKDIPLLEVKKRKRNDWICLWETFRSCHILVPCAQIKFTFISWKRLLAHVWSIEMQLFPLKPICTKSYLLTSQVT